jgi:hypothetical protein
MLLLVVLAVLVVLIYIYVLEQVQSSRWRLLLSQNNIVGEMPLTKSDWLVGVLQLS